MTRLESTPFQKCPEIREKFSENLEAMPETEKDKLDYIWVVVIEGTAHPQFLDNGEELKYSEVKNKDFEAVYFVPLDPELDSIGIESREKQLRVSRRGYPQFRKHSVKELGRITDILYRHAQHNEKERFKEKLVSVMHNDGEMSFSEELHRYGYLIEAGDEVAFISDHGEVDVKRGWNYDMKTYKDENSDEWQALSRYE